MLVKLALPNRSKIKSHRTGKQVAGPEPRMQTNPNYPDSEPEPSPTLEEDDAERRLRRRLQIMVGMVTSVLSQDPDLTFEEAHRMIEDCRQAALAMFPGKELPFDMIYRPRLERVTKERFPQR